MYKRLTERIENSDKYMLKIPDMSEEISDIEVKFNAYDKLGRLEDLEEQLIAHTGMDLREWVKHTTSLFDVKKEIDDFEANCERLISEKEHINTTTKMASETRIGIMERLEICDEIVSMIIITQKDYGYKENVALHKIISELVDLESVFIGNVFCEENAVTVGDITIRISDDRALPCKYILNPQGLHNETEDIVALSKALFEDKLNSIEDERLLNLYEDTDDYIFNNAMWKGNLISIKDRWTAQKVFMRLKDEIEMER